LQGIIFDQTKAGSRRAAVTVTNMDTGVVKDTTTNGEGFYRVTTCISGRELQDRR